VAVLAVLMFPTFLRPRISLHLSSFACFRGDNLRVIRGCSLPCVLRWYVALPDACTLPEVKRGKTSKYGGCHEVWPHGSSARYGIESLASWCC
jgi:hypothetical protein